MQTYYTISHFHQGDLKTWKSTDIGFPSSKKFDSLEEAKEFLLSKLEKKEEYYDRTGIHATDLSDQYLIIENSTPYPEKQIKRTRIVLIYEEGKTKEL